MVGLLRPDRGAKDGADDQNRTGDLVLTKDALCQLSYIGSIEFWSGRRGSNPRPTAWKAVTLPLSYSRLRGSLGSPLRRGRPACRPFSIASILPSRPLPQLACLAEAR